MTYSVLVVDDSALMRKTVSNIILRDKRFEVVGLARNGRDALEKIQRFMPSIVTMDVEMPEMDGLTAVQHIMSQCPVAVVMLSSVTGQGTHTTIQALELGALDCFSKEELLSGATDEVISDFHTRLIAAAEANRDGIRYKHGAPLDGRIDNVDKESSDTMSKERADFALTASNDATLGHLESSKKAYRTDVDAILIGCSTGGPAALQSILPKLASNLKVPVIVIQHMPTGFTKALAQRFDGLCRLPVKEAEDGEVLKSGVIYVAPAGTQTVLTRGARRTVVARLTDISPVETRFRPSVDVTLLSAVSVYRERLLSIILTGMGTDGALGCKEAHRVRGKVWVQSKESCVVYGMPRAVWEAGLAEQQVSLDRIGDEINRVVAFGSQGAQL